MRVRIKKSKHCASEYFSTIGYPTLLYTRKRSKAKHSMAQTISKEITLLLKEKKKEELIKLKNKIKSCPFSYCNKENRLFSKEKFFFLLNKTHKVINQVFQAFFQSGPLNKSLFKISPEDI